MLSSPYLRCVQTVEPLAGSRGLEVEGREELGEDTQESGLAVVVREVAARNVVICVHGGAAQALAQVPTHKKGGVWVLDGVRPVRYLSAP